MIPKLEKLKQDLERLIKLGDELLSDLIQAQSSEKRRDKQEKAGQGFSDGYQDWYTLSSEVVRQLLPQRLNEFEELYKKDRRRNISSDTYTIQDWLLCIEIGTDLLDMFSFDRHNIAVKKFQNQLGILKSAQARFESSLFEIRQIVQADLFDSEIEVARELYKNGFLRASGAVCGVVLEKHLTEVCLIHNLPIKKKAPSISDLNDILRQGDVIDVPTLRFVQRLADLRNLCCHKKEREPTKEDVDDLIIGVEKITKSLF